jgi:hypothetical protein
MKTLLVCFFFCLPLMAQSDLDAKIASFKEAEAKAPQGFPTLFVVSSASSQSGGILGNDECEMYLSTLGTRYFVTSTEGGIRTRCKVFRPGTPIFGKVHRALLGQTIDVLDDSEGKAKKLSYVIKDSEMVDPAQQ